MFEETINQQEFHAKLEQWGGTVGLKPMALNLIDGVRIQGPWLCLELVGDDGDDEEWAIPFSELVKKHGEFIRFSHPDDAEERKAEIIKALRDAIAEIETQQSCLAENGM